MKRSPDRWVAVVLTLAGAVGFRGHADARSGAQITASFAEFCRDVAVHATKDISHVVIHYADGRDVKDESIDSPDYSVDGGDGDEIASITVKASTTIETFVCDAGGSPPTALIESRRCGFGVCGDWTATDSDGSHERCSHAFDPIPFRGTSSSDPDGDLVSWSIDFGDGSPSVGGAWSTSPPADISHVFAFTGGLVTVTLTLVDATGLASSDTIVVCLADFTPD